MPLLLKPILFEMPMRTIQQVQTESLCLCINRQGQFVILVLYKPVDLKTIKVYGVVEARAGWKKMMSKTDKYEVTPLPDTLCARRNHKNDFGEPWKYSFKAKGNLNTQYKTLIQNHKNYVRDQKNWYDIEGILVRDGNEYFREKYRNRQREP
jgi:hypothetical protein